MVHNGIEYGIMAAYAEGLNILQHANVGKNAQETDAETTPLREPEHYRYDFDLPDVTEVWRRGSVIASWLLDLTAVACSTSRRSTRSRAASRLRRGPVDGLAAIDEGVPVPVLAAVAVRALRLARRGGLRRRCCRRCGNGFGGHSSRAGRA